MQGLSHLDLAAEAPTAHTFLRMSAKNSFSRQYQTQKARDRDKRVRFPLIFHKFLSLVPTIKTILAKDSGISAQNPKIWNSESVGASADQGLQFLNWEKVMLLFHLEANDQKVD